MTSPYPPNPNQPPSQPIYPPTGYYQPQQPLSSGALPQPPVPYQQPQPYMVQPIMLQPPTQTWAWWNLAPWWIKALFILGILALLYVVVGICAGVMIGLFGGAVRP